MTIKEKRIKLLSDYLYTMQITRPLLVSAPEAQQKRDKDIAVAEAWLKELKGEDLHEEG